MTDWATEFIHTRFDMHQPLTVETVAGWLREAREGALEEAAEAVAYLRWQEVDPFDGRTLGHSVNTIRALKDKT